VTGTAATLELDFIADRLTLRRSDGENAIAYQKPTDRNRLYAAELSDLLHAMRTGQAPTVPLTDGIATLRIIEAARRSSSTGQPVALGNG
jgi:predicted dehydrogenase